MKEILALHEWFLGNKRDFPWRVDPSPYRVLVSEMMLQQTRANVVVAYFDRWMRLFPTIQALAEAPIEEIIKAWEGLGYYSRARHLHTAAVQIIRDFGGEIPNDPKELKKIKGLGPYTIGAILSFGFNQRAPAIDGNVSRVLSRYFLVEENISRIKVKNQLAQLAEQCLDRKEPWITAEALIELGASLCAPKPRCADCPLRSGCLGFRTGKAVHLPLKPAPIETTNLYRIVLILEHEHQVLVKKGASGKVMAGLYEFPYLEVSKTPSQIQQLMKDAYGISERGTPLNKVKHSFTRYQAHLFPYHIKLKNTVHLDEHCWVEISKLDLLPFSSGHRRILKLWVGS